MISITGGSRAQIYSMQRLGTDTLNGGGGTNTISFINAASAVNINLTSGTTSGWVTDGN